MGFERGGVNVPSNHPFRVTATADAPEALLSMMYVNLENHAEDGWTDRDVSSLDRHLVFDERGIHEVIIVGVSAKAPGGDYKVSYEMVDATTQKSVLTGAVAFGDSPAATARVTVVSY